MWIAGGIYFLVIICMATGLVPLTSAAMLGAMLCVITRCMTLTQAQAGIDWTTVWLFAGMLSMSFAMNKSGAAQLIADFVVSYFSDPYKMCIRDSITDGRFSGGSRGAAIGHVSPEAADGGLIGLVQDGDTIHIDIPGRKLELVLSLIHI